MEQLTKLITSLNSIVWGPAMLVLILGVGLFLMLGLRLMPLLKTGTAFKLLWQGRRADGSEKDSGEIPPFQALMTAMSATVGTGNIAGVATAVFLGGPGALFWMWCTAVVGMATKYAEAVLAVEYREVDANGNHVGGPMYYIKNGLGKNWAWLATAFAGFGAIAAFGIGNTVQANSVAEVLETNFAVDKLTSGLVMAALAGAVLIGGIKRIGLVAGKLVPFMAFAYILAGLISLALNIEAIPEALSLIISSAFSPTAIQGGFMGATVLVAIQLGVERGIFSNEAGLGSAPIAHAAAKTNSPVRQGLIAMLGTLLDTLVVCTITGLVIITSGLWTSGDTGSALTSAAFANALPNVGNYIVVIALAVFAFTTILGWSFYGERCMEYLFGLKVIFFYRAAWIGAIVVGATSQLDFIWLLASVLNALMAIPNLIALALLSPVVFKLSRAYFKD